MISSTAAALYTRWWSEVSARFERDRHEVQSGPAPDRGGRPEGVQDTMRLRRLWSGAALTWNRPNQRLNCASGGVAVAGDGVRLEDLVLPDQHVLLDLARDLVGQRLAHRLFHGAVAAGRLQ